MAKPANPEQSRIDRIQQLRAEHQRRHMERSGQYVPEEREENHYESDLRKVIINNFVKRFIVKEYCYILI